MRSSRRLGERMPGGLRNRLTTTTRYITSSTTLGFGYRYSYIFTWAELAF